MKKTIIYLCAMFFFVYTLRAQTLLSHDFNDGTFGPYEVNKSSQNSRVYIKDNAIETRWDQKNYDGTNSGRKAQFRPIGWDPNNWRDGFYFQSEIWAGFKLKIHDDYMKDNTNTDACLMQIWGNQGSDLGNHYAMLKFDGRNGGELTWYNRWCCGSAHINYWLVESNFPRDQFVDVVIHVDLSSNGGTVKIWLDGELKLSTNNQTMGWGEMDASGMINDTYSTMSFGQYNYRANGSFDESYYSNNHYFDGHLTGETRTVTYDNLSLWNGSNGFDVVDPDKESLSSILIDNAQNNKVLASPNPVTDVLNVNSEIGAKITLYNSLGSIVYSSIAEKENTSIDVNYLKQGVYFLQLNMNGNIGNQKVVKLNSK